MKFIGAIIGFLFVIFPILSIYQILIFGAFSSESSHNGADKLAMIALLVIPIVLFFSLNLLGTFLF